MHQRLHDVQSELLRGPFLHLFNGDISIRISSKFSADVRDVREKTGQKGRIKFPKEKQLHCKIVITVIKANDVPKEGSRQTAAPSSR